MTAKVDLKRTLDAYSAKRGELRAVEVPDLQYLMVDGQGNPNSSSAFADAVAALYPVAYTVKFASKVELQRDYVVPPLEGLWWAEDMDVFTAARDKARWSWTLLILVPEWIEPTLVDAAVRRVANRNAPARLHDVRLEALTEGPCLQTLHVGPFDEEAEVMARLHDAVRDRGFVLAGRHHEIYLSDFRRVPPERQRTILRQPVAPAGLAHPPVRPASAPASG